VPVVTLKATYRIWCGSPNYQLSIINYQQFKHFDSAYLSG